VLLPLSREQNAVIELPRPIPACRWRNGLVTVVLVTGCASRSAEDAGADSSALDAPTLDVIMATDTPRPDVPGAETAPSRDSSCVGVDAPTDVQNMNPPDGARVECRTTANCLGIGRHCTMGGGQCDAEQNFCDRDLSPMGQGICIRIGCAVGHHDCGPGATCCSTEMTQFTPVCVPSDCRPSDCPLEAP
jgi:hypothetical protein